MVSLFYWVILLQVFLLVIKMADDKLTVNRIRKDESKPKRGRQAAGADGFQVSEDRAPQLQEEDKRTTTQVLDETIRMATEAEQVGGRTMQQLAVQRGRLWSIILLGFPLTVVVFLSRSV